MWPARASTLGTQTQPGPDDLAPTAASHARRHALSDIVSDLNTLFKCCLAGGKARGRAARWAPLALTDPTLLVLAQHIVSL